MRIDPKVATTRKKIKNNLLLYFYFLYNIKGGFTMINLTIPEMNEPGRGNLDRSGNGYANREGMKNQDFLMARLTEYWTLPTSPKG